MRASKSTLPFLKALGIVTFFWWMVLFIFSTMERGLLYPNEHPSGIDFLRDSLYPLQMVGIDLGVVLLCTAWTLRAKFKARYLIWQGLGQDEHFGLISSMGRIELSVFDPNSRQHLSLLEEEQLIGALKGEFSTLIRNFIKQTQHTQPAIANAMRSCLAVLCQHPHFPASSQSLRSQAQHSNDKALNSHELKVTKATSHRASFEENHHGHCTLLEHSLRVAAFAISERESFNYQGLQTELRTLIAPGEGFHFDHKDPLPILLALVHDIGKLKTFKLGAQFEVHQVKGHHGPVGALFLAQLDCIKRLAPHQRQVLSKALYHYHNPYHFNLRHLNRIDDDYLVANMMLLINADKKASLAERRGYLTKNEALFFSNYPSQ